MKATTNRSPTTVAESVPDLSVKVILTLCCLGAGLWPIDAIFAQAKPRPVPSPPAAENSTPRDTAEHLAETAPTAPQHASPEADDAIAGMLSRTAPPGKSDGTDTKSSDVLARRLWQNRILAPDPNEDDPTQRDLKDLIQRVRSVRFTSGDSEPTFSMPPEPVAETQRPPTQTGTNAEPQPTPAPVRTAATRATPLAALSPATQKELNALLQDPNQVHDPFEMAELLFLSGRPAEATVFYEKALAQISPDDSAGSDDRAWILFQLGNCLRETDMTKAKDTYMKLVNQYPSSPWTELAKAHGRLISWYQTARPQQWMTPQQSP
ncbi:MAG: tetratricopeptide repeat protein [Planctomycetota bacterium]